MEIKNKKIYVCSPLRGDIEQNIENKSFSVTIVTKQGEESVVSVPEGQMQTEEFSIGDIVFLDDDGMLEQAFDKED